MPEKDDVWIHTICNMCPGDCGIVVHRVNGVIVKVEGDPDCPNSLGKICAKGHAAIMSVYDPNRVKTPLKRTNPEKGLGVDPKWERISWDEALDILERKLSQIRKDNPKKLAISTFDNYVLRDIIPPWTEAYGTPNYYWVGYFCGQYLHSSMYLTNGTFHCDFDADLCNYLLLFGNQAGFMAGLNPNITAQKVAVGRKQRAMKIVAIDPICSNAAAKADEWVPIRPGTDGAMVLAMINVLINELGVYDRQFLKKYTNAPYLVKPDGFYARHNNKPLVWDITESKAKPYDEAVADCAFEGTFVVDGVNCTPAFQLLKENVKKYTPEMASEITTVPAGTIRRLAAEFGREAKIGATIVIDGKELPYRPAAANIYRGAGAHKHGVGVALSVQILNMVIGNFYVPGGHRGVNAVGPKWSWRPGSVDGLITPPEGSGHGTRDYYTYKVKPPETLGLDELFPLSTNRSPIFLLNSLEPDKHGLPYKPEALLVCRRNLFLAGVSHKITAAALKNYSFLAVFTTFLDEVAEFADLVLPDSHTLERFQLFPNITWWSNTMQTGYIYWGLRQPVIAPVGEAREWGDVLLELADRMGFLGEVYTRSNKTLQLKGEYQLDPTKKYTKEEIFQRRIKSQFGPEKDLDWFKQNGFVSVKRTVDELYPLPWMNVRFPVYFENFLAAKRQLTDVLQQSGITGWDLSDYEPMPNWRACDPHPEEGLDLYAANFRVPTHFQSWTAENPWLSEVARLNPYAQKILINAKTARERGIADGDKICVESCVSKLIGRAKVTECIHPETIGISSHFGGFAKGKPIALGKGVNFNNLLPFGLKHIDPVSTGIDACVRVKVYKVDDGAKSN